MLTQGQYSVIVTKWKKSIFGLDASKWIITKSKHCHGHSNPTPEALKQMNDFIWEGTCHSVWDNVYEIHLCLHVFFGRDYIETCNHRYNLLRGL